MISRCTLLVMLFGLLAGGGCCCGGRVYQSNCGGPGLACGANCGPRCNGPLCRAYEQRVSSGCSTCGTCCPDVGCGGFKGWLTQGATCGRGCGSVYAGEWISDPPDCCDPCNRCNGDFTGSGCCGGPGLLARIARGVQGARCGGGCGLCGGAGCSSCGGSSSCGGGGCTSCGDGLSSGGSVIHSHSGGVLNENWDPAPAPRPTPGKPIHKAQVPAGRVKVSSAPQRLPSGRQSIKHPTKRPIKRATYEEETDE